MADEEENNYIEIEDDEEEDGNQVCIYLYNLIFILLQEGGMNIDLNKAMKDCEGIEKVQERTNTGVVSLLSIIVFISIYLILQRQKFDSATYEKNKQEQGKK